MMRTPAIISVTPLEGFRFLAVFADGARRAYNVELLFDDIPAFRLMKRNPWIFKQAKPDVGGFGVVWNDLLDLSADEVYDHGEPVEIV